MFLLIIYDIIDIMETIINEFKYNDKEIVVLKDSTNMIWFNGYNVCKILGYSTPKDIIRKLVNKKHIKYLKNIFEDYKLYPNAQPNSVYLNKLGLYTLLLEVKNQMQKSFSYGL